MISRPTFSSSTSATDRVFSPRTAIRVAAGLVFREGRLLITQRPSGTHLAGLWEFPGGKLEPGESWEECLVRELDEELGIEIEVQELVEEMDHEYPEKAVKLKFFRCLWLCFEPQPIGCSALKWIASHELESFEFPAADRKLLDRLRCDIALWNHSATGL